MLPRVPRNWVGETAFIVAGGESVTQGDVDRLRGRRVVVVNSSYEKAPWADALVFTDLRWWRMHRRRVRAIFRGQVVTLTPRSATFDDDMLVYERQRSSGVSTDPTRIAWWHTTLTTTLNYVSLRGAHLAAVLGLDGRGGWHHDPHPVKWGVNAKKFAYHGEALEAIKAPLLAMGTRVVNLNPDSSHRMFEFATLDDVLQERVAA